MKETAPKTAPELGTWAQSKGLCVEYKTDLGVALTGDSEQLLKSRAFRSLTEKVQLIFTSPPFPLNRKKKYGNLSGIKFRKWLSGYASHLRSLLQPDGSIVIEMGNAWEQGSPVMSTLALETLLTFKRAGNFHLCQEFVWFNPAKLPTPAQWVTIDRIRVKDSFTRLWWLSPTKRPKADNRRVLQPYSGSMKSLLQRGHYNSGRRPSEHRIGAKSFLANNGGSIPPNVISPTEEELDNLLIEGNTHNSGSYHQFCRALDLKPHPARMPISLAKFFINLCTEPSDLVLDPFGGSNTTGAAAEALGRRWISIEAEASYAQASRGRFPSLWTRNEKQLTERAAVSGAK
jgi:site-specific DNA-methyltransferase (cytosine-N4-specific)